MAKTRITVTIDEDIYKWVKQMSESKGIPVSFMVNKYFKELRIKHVK